MPTHSPTMFAPRTAEIIYRRTGHLLGEYRLDEDPDEGCFDASELLDELARRVASTWAQISRRRSRGQAVDGELAILADRELEYNAIAPYAGRRYHLIDRAQGLRACWHLNTARQARGLPLLPTCDEPHAHEAIGPETSPRSAACVYGEQGKISAEEASRRCTGRVSISGGPDTAQCMCACHREARDLARLTARAGR